jgi:hypothetical protein
MSFLLTVILLISNGEEQYFTTVQVPGFKTQQTCERDAAAFSVTAVRNPNDTKVILKHCSRIN